MQWVTSSTQVHKVASTIVGLKHDHILLTRVIRIANCIRLTTSRKVLHHVIRFVIGTLGVLFALIIVIITSASSLDITRVAIRVFVGQIEVICSLLALSSCTLGRSLSLVK